MLLGLVDDPPAQGDGHGLPNNRLPGALSSTTTEVQAHPTSAQDASFAAYLDGEQQLCP
jgi:hypothetical protein